MPLWARRSESHPLGWGSAAAKTYSEYSEYSGPVKEPLNSLDAEALMSVVGASGVRS